MLSEGCPVQAEHIWKMWFPLEIIEVGYFYDT